MSTGPSPSFDESIRAAWPLTIAAACEVPVPLMNFGPMPAIGARREATEPVAMTLWIERAGTRTVGARSFAVAALAEKAAGASS